MTFDPSKPVIAVDIDGRQYKAGVLYHQADLVLAVIFKDASTILGHYLFNANGKIRDTHIYFHLINIPPEPRKVERWINFYDDGDGSYWQVHSTEHAAKITSNTKAFIATIKLTGEIPAEIADKIEGGGE